MRASRLVLVTLLATPLVQAQNDSSDGLTLLQQMSQHYASATTWYIQATEERTLENKHCSESDETNIIGAESGNEYHYESHTGTGSALHISDGTTAWDFHPGNHEYKKQAAPADGYTPDQSSYMAEVRIFQAMGLRKDFADLAKHYNSATRRPDEVLHDTGFDVPCYVVEVTTADRKDPKPAGESMSETFWIDQRTWSVWRRARHEDTFTIVGGVHIPIAIDSFTRYSTVQLSGPVPSDLFHFQPPGNATLVDKFSDRLLGPDMTGQPAPDVLFVAADGTSASLSSYRGKPVLLDFWATWCKPCIQGLPKIAELAKDIAANGLVVLGVDEDEDEKKATEFLAEHNYKWHNSHDDGSIHEAFNKEGLPHIVLIDGQGKIVFDKPGEDDYGLRTAIAALGLQYASLAPAPKPQAACETASKQPPSN